MPPHTAPTAPSHTVPSHTAPSRRRPFLRLPTTRQVETLLRLALALTLVGTTLWYAYWALSGGATSQAPTAAGTQNLLLSGAITTRLEAHDLERVTCSPTGFHLQTAPGSPVRLELSFRSAARSAPTGSSYTLLGSGEDRFALAVDRNPFTLLSGTVTLTPEGRRFSASLVDRYSQPLWVSGQLRCPPAPQSNANP